MKSAFDVAVDNGGDFGSDLDDELLQYSSTGSVDRSSIGSIPWADDAIKQNQLDWERVERMLMGEETLPDNSTETELRNEVLEWQRKFPQLLGKRSAKQILHQPSQSFDSAKTNFDLESLSNLSLNSSDGDIDARYDEDDEDDYDNFPTPTPQWQHQSMQLKVPTSTRRAVMDRAKSRIGPTADLLVRDFCINSLPLTLSKRQTTRNAVQRSLGSDNGSTSSASSSKGCKQIPPPPPPVPLKHAQLPQSQRKSPKPNFHKVPHVERLRMPPIMNVLESKRRFCGLASNRSFVQLTKVQQAKSAVVSAPKQPIESTAIVYGGGGRNKSAWHVPLAAATVSNRFFNNRNAIILPALNLQRIGMHHATTSTMTTSETATATMSNSDSTAEKAMFTHFVPKAHTFTNNSTTTPSSGVRSISAAVHPHSSLHAFYLPYSAAKFKSFK